MKRVLIACERSQVLCSRFRHAGFAAFSCDILPSYGPCPEYHILGDAAKVIQESWDLVIAHPPCTYLTIAGACHNSSDPSRIDKGFKAAEFFMLFYNLPIPHCVENPLPQRRFKLPPYSQIIQPFEFGHPYSKRTCLWLHDLPLLLSTCFCPSHSSWVIKHRSSKLRSQTFTGIADAMVQQWADYI